LTQDVNQGGPSDCPFENASEFGNVTQFANPDTNIDDLTFGQISSTTIGNLQTQRIVQIAGRLTF